jgi:pimeloyl-ACP methyl ester carboxylesterase
VAALLNSDFTLWLLGLVVRPMFLTLSGISKSMQNELAHDPIKMEVIMSIIRPLPISQRKSGFDNDLEQFADLATYDLSPITAPTMVLHGTADTVVPLSHGEFVARSIPHATMVTIEGGGHLCVVTHKEQALPALLGFLEEHAPANAMPVPIPGTKWADTGTDGNEAIVDGKITQPYSHSSTEDHNETRA